MSEELLRTPGLVTRGFYGSKKSELVAVVDWVQVTFKTSDFYEVFNDLIGIQKSHFKKEHKGYFGYNRQLTFGNIKIAFNEFTPKELEEIEKSERFKNDDEMGYHLILTGSGCRQLDYYLEQRNLTWFDFLDKCLKHRGSFTRLDLAIDDYKTYFAVENLVKKIKSGEMVSRFRSAFHYEKIEVAQGISAGRTLYIGSPSSSVRFRLYEKNYEQAYKYNVPVEEIGDWNRYEVQMRDKQAQKCVQQIIKSEDLEFVIKSIMNNSFRFVVRGNTKDKRKWKIYRPWNQFVKEASKISLSIRPEVKSIEDYMKWIDKQVVNVLNTVLVAEREAKYLGLLKETDWLSGLLASGHIDKDKRQTINLFLEELRHKKELT
ncbi:replication initiation factor domain-containing protein [Staphylococcus aureus]|uniref:replication initiation factor domain-containing protein n=1 Tax=Staphylococcus aureus TaxID=1280 RepID=UPI0005C7BDCE|nr:replication initiation factor domain-containing protein [Staphylococcus aureus]HDH6083000.1 replication initiation factor domain-containing protein [Staphylococcus aureus]